METFSTPVIPEPFKTVMLGLQQNNMAAQYIPCKVDVPAAVRVLLRKGQRIAVGGSVTLEECHILDLLRSGDYHFIDRYEAGLDDTQQKQRLIDAFSADVFLCSANAITMGGEIYQVDGLSNRIAPLVYGPDSVLLQFFGARTSADSTTHSSSFGGGAPGLLTKIPAVSLVSVCDPL